MPLVQEKDEFLEPNHPIYSRDFRKFKTLSGALTAPDVVLVSNRSLRQRM